MSQHLSLYNISRTISHPGGMPTYPTLCRLVNGYKLQPVAQSTKSDLYDVGQVCKMLDDHYKSTNSNNETDTSVDGLSYGQIRTLKVSEEYTKLKLENQELRRTLISTRETKDFLTFRFGVENAILRRILFVNIPIEITGLSTSKARKRVEEYYNMIQEVMRETIQLYDAEYKTDESTIHNDTLQRIIKQLDDAIANIKPDSGQCSNSVSGSSTQTSSQ